MRTAEAEALESALTIKPIIRYREKGRHEVACRTPPVRPESELPPNDLQAPGPSRRPGWRC